MKEQILREYASGDLRAFLMNFAEYQFFAYDFTLSEEQVCKMAVALTEGD